VQPLQPSRPSIECERCRQHRTGLSSDRADRGEAVVDPTRRSCRPRRQLLPFAENTPAGKPAIYTYRDGAAYPNLTRRGP